MTEEVEIGLKIGTPAQVKWQKLKEDALKTIDDAYMGIEVNKALIKLADKKIAEEEKKLSA